MDRCLIHPRIKFTSPAQQLNLLLPKSTEHIIHKNKVSSSSVGMCFRKAGIYFVFVGRQKREEFKDSTRAQVPGSTPHPQRR